MEANTLDNGKMAKLMAMAKCSMLMEMCMKEIGLKIKLMVMGSIPDQMARSMKEVG